MTRLKGLFMMSLVLLLASCSKSAESEEEELDGITLEVIESLDKAKFLEKVYNYEKNETQWVYEGDKPCLISYYVNWSGPSRKMTPILVELAEVYANDIIIYKINVDKEKELASAIGIQNIPSFLFVPLEGLPQLSSGALPKEEFIKLIDYFLIGRK